MGKLGGGHPLSGHARGRHGLQSTLRGVLRREHAENGRGRTLERLALLVDGAHAVSARTRTHIFIRTI
jgi:hypothetical protein